MTEEERNNRMKMHALDATKHLERALKDWGIKLSVLEQTAAISRMLLQHGEHISCHAIGQEDVDPYKIVSWYGFSIIDALDLDHESPEDILTVEKISQAMIMTMAGYLNRESEGRLILPMNTRKLILSMIKEEFKENDRQGIGKNGLYAAYHFAVMTLKMLDNPESRLSEL